MFYKYKDINFIKLTDIDFMFERTQTSGVMVAASEKTAMLSVRCMRDH